jgi:hypothetical protein
MEYPCLSAIAGYGNVAATERHVVCSRNVADNGEPRGAMALREHTIVAIAT